MERMKHLVLLTVRRPDKKHDRPDCQGANRPPGFCRPLICEHNVWIEEAGLRSWVLSHGDFVRRVGNAIDDEL
jgi:hypothetical protein